MSSPSDANATATAFEAGPDSAAERTAGADASSRAATDDPAGPEPGDVVARYIVVAKLGAGAMGVVVAAYDPKLDRKVALKLLRPRGRGQEAARTRLQREAQALAKLAHPNVVAVHDVGVHQGRVFLAMEHVEGQTLRAWLAAGARSVAEIVEVFVQAGRGLAAAHEAGLVHRDFKPDNVMIDVRGRVRVMDFGLARADERADAGDEGARRYRHDDALAVPLTHTGAIMGTPAYMAPEQLFGADTDARSDQFAFCVALHEALHGERPFAGKTVSELAIAAQEGAICLPAHPRAVPAALRKAIQRGLAAQADARWPTMEALLGELERRPAGARRLGWAAAFVLAPTLVGLGVFATMDREPEPCAGLERRWEGVWDQAGRERLLAGLRASERPWAAGIAARVEARLDAYTASWTEARTDACVATRVHGDQSEQLMDLRIACLDDRREEVELLLGVLGSRESGVLERSIQAVDALSPLEPCADTEALLSAVERPRDPARLAELERSERDLAEATALARAGQWKQAQERTRELVTRAEELGYRPLLLDAMANRAKLEEWSGATASAVASQRETFFLAVESGDAEAAARAAAELAFLEGNTLGHFEVGLGWVEHALPHARASGDPDRLSHALSARGNIAFRQGRYEDADRDLVESLKLEEANHAPTHRGVLAARSNLGNVAYLRGDYDAARGHYSAVLEAKIESLGADHPELASAETNLANVETDLGNLEEAKRLYRSALARNRASVGEQSPVVADGLANLGRVATIEGDAAAARALQHDALRIREAVLPAGHWQLGVTLADLADCERSAGELEQAREHYLRALEIEESSLGPEHMYLAYPMLGMGELEAAAGNPREAQTWMERALALREKSGEASGTIADTAFALAKLLWDARPPVRDRERASALVRDAIERYGGAGPGAAAREREAEAWLREHEADR